MWPRGSSGRRRLGVVAAMREEVAPLINAMAEVRRPDRRLPIVLGLCGEVELAVTWTGEGSRLAVAGTQRLLAASHDSLDGCLVMGVAGALSPSLEVGTVLVAEKIVRLPDVGCAESCQAEIAPSDFQIRGPRSGLLLEVDGVVTQPEQRRELWVRLGNPGVAAVDMESFGVTKELVGAGVPCSVLRVISDTAQDVLPAFLASCHDPELGVVRARVVRNAIARPWTLFRLLRLRSRVRRGASSLSDCVTGWCLEGARSIELAMTFALRWAWRHYRPL